MKCPVCNHEYEGNSNICPMCGFPEVGCTFERFNAEEWMNTTVNCCRSILNKVLSLHSVASVTLEDELEKYIPYKDYCSKLQADPHDYKSRSWLVDYLTQIIVFRYNYPVENRKELIREAISHISFFFVNANARDEIRLGYTATIYQAVLAEVYLSEWDLVSAMGCYYNFLSEPLFSSDIAEACEEDGIIMHVNEIYVILHNCAVLCKLIGNKSLHEKFDFLCKKVDEVGHQFESDKEYNNIYFRGFIRCILSAENGKDANDYLSTDCSKECTYNSCCICQGGNMFFMSELNVVSGYMIKVASSYNSYVMDVAPPIEQVFILEQKCAIEFYAKRILAMFKH